MSFEQEIAQYLEAGGRISVYPGFTEIKPLPEGKHPIAKRRVKTAKGATTLPAGTVDITWIAEQCGYKSPEGISANKRNASKLPKPLKKKGPRGTRLFDRRQAEIYIESVKAYREGLKASPEDSLYRRVMVQS